MTLLAQNTSHVSEDCKATLLLCHEFGEGRLHGDAKPLSTWEYGQLVRFLQELGARPAAVLQAETAEPILAQLPHELPATRVRSLLARGLSLSLALETWRSRGIWVISRADSIYPSRLKERFRLEAPPVLFGVGTSAFLDAGGLGVFGSRNVDEEGLKFAYDTGTRCAKENLMVLSGCARGVDWAAMSGCLEAGGNCVGVIAEKLDRAAVSGQYRQYIRENRLALISMFAPEAPFFAAHAKGRDKYTYALSDYALVVSAEKNKGGTWAGATEQLTRLRHVPVYVRSEGRLPPGNPPLLAMGARSFPVHTRVSSLVSFFHGQDAQSGTTFPTFVSEPEQNDLGAQVDLFPEVVAKPVSGKLPKAQKKRLKVKQPISVADELAEYAIKLLLKTAGSTVTPESAASSLGVSIEQAAAWLAKVKTQKT